MPAFDRSGPMGAGPMTGGRRGLCGRAAVTADVPAYGGFGYGRGMSFRRGGGRGFGPGRGYGRGFGGGGYRYPSTYSSDVPMDATEEMSMLKSEADYMKKAMETINKRIGVLEKEPSESS